MVKNLIAGGLPLYRPMGGVLVFVWLAVAGLSAESVQGVVVENLPEQRAIRFQPGKGPAMDFIHVGKGDSLLDYAGRTVRGQLTVRDGKARLDSIWPVLGVQGNAMEGVNRSLQREAASLGRGKSLVEGDYLPGFALIDQYAKPVFSSRLKKNPVILSFIFTRCKAPEMCPATTKRMVHLSEVVRERGWDDVQLILISFDPEYDTPGILRQYAGIYGIKGDRLLLLTGEEPTIEALLRLFGVRVLDEDGTLNHNLVTLLTDDHGRIVLRQDGSRWSADAILAELKSGESGS